ncbi:hypothetical protein H9636_07085 [Ureibacillus sp. Re31]|uniref:Fur-regulated basic protein B n=1 Tax=Ureibacillus galli TaxID=2762222 RepID=A0ABR8XBB3_9BACL|nr:hypothetical protein [Ureibacillus galli]
MWRPILEKMLTYQEARSMTQHELFEANAALDIHLEKIEQAREAKK